MTVNRILIFFVKQNHFFVYFKGNQIVCIPILPVGATLDQETARSFQFHLVFDKIIEKLKTSADYKIRLSPYYNMLPR